MLESVLTATIAALVWTLLAVIVAILGCAAFAEFGANSSFARHIGAVGRFVSSKLQS